MIFKEYKSAIIISVVLHLVMLAILLWGQLFSSSHKKPVGQMVEAVVIDPKLIAQQAKSIRESRETVQKTQQEDLDKQRKQAQKEEEERQKILDKKRQEKEQDLEKQKQRLEEEQKAKEEAIKKAEEEKQAKLDALKKAEAEQKAKEEAAKKAEAEKQAKLEAQKKAEAEQKAKEEAAKKAEAEKQAKLEAQKKAEAEQKAKEEAAKKAEAEKQAKLEAEKKAAAAKASEQAVLDDIFAGNNDGENQVSVAKQKYIATEVDRYGAIYKQMIQKELFIDDSFKGKSCRVNIRLIQSGSGAIVSSVSTQGGDPQVCSATKNAIAKIESFPMPTDQSVANELKNINLTVEPQ